MTPLITGGTVISMEPATGELDRGEVLLEDDVIVEVAEHVDAPVGVHKASTSWRYIGL